MYTYSSIYIHIHMRNLNLHTSCMYIISMLRDLSIDIIKVNFFFYVLICNRKHINIHAKLEKLKSKKFL